MSTGKTFELRLADRREPQVARIRVSADSLSEKSTFS
jgi:hypothetical protein